MTPLQEDLLDAVLVVTGGSTGHDSWVPTRLLHWYEPDEGGSFRGGVREAPDWPRFVEDRHHAEADHPAIRGCLEAIDGALHPAWQGGTSGKGRGWAVEQVFEGCCERVLDPVDPTDLRDEQLLAERVDDACPELLRFLAGATHSIGFACPLAGLRLPHGAIPIDHNTRLEPLADREREALWRRVTPGHLTSLAFHFPSMGDVEAAFSQIVISVDLPAGQALPMDVLQHPMWDVVDVVRLGVEGRPYPLAAFETFPKFDVYLGRFYSLGLLRPGPVARVLQMLLTRSEPEDHRRVSLSLAKKAAAFSGCRAPRRGLGSLAATGAAPRARPWSDLQRHRRRYKSEVHVNADARLSLGVSVGMAAGSCSAPVAVSAVRERSRRSLSFCPAAVR